MADIQSVTAEILGEENKRRRRKKIAETNYRTKI